MPILGTMITSTTYGTWLRGDQRGWVEDGQVLPHDPLLQLQEFARLKYEPYLFAKPQLLAIGSMILESLDERLQLRPLALTIQTWHIHLVIPATTHTLPVIVKCFKDAVRYGLRLGRPIWTDGYDHRHCYDWERLHDRVHYVECHNTREGWPTQPWPQLMKWDEYIKSV